MENPETLPMFYAAMLTLLGLAFAVLLGFALRTISGVDRLARYARRSGLPVPTDGEGALTARTRRERIAESSAALVGIALSAAVLLTPLGRSPLFPLAVFLPLLLLTMQLSATTLALRDQLFAPPPAAPRVARMARMTTTDFVGAPRRALSLALAVLAACGAAWVVIASAKGVLPHPEVMPAVLVVSSVAVLLTITLPAFDGAVLARPQAASTPLELAWADVFRSSALNGTRLSAALFCFAALLLSASALVPSPGPSASWPLSLFVFGQIALSRIYPTAGARLPRKLFPNGIRVAAGSTA